MEEYQVTEEDLVGELEGFPIEVVQKMVDYQVEQGNKADVTVFQTDRCQIVEHGGFDWVETKDGVSFWGKVLSRKDFDVFFEKYPKKEIDTHVYYRGNSERGNEIISELEKLGGKNDYEAYRGLCEDSIYFISPIYKQIRRIGIDNNIVQGDLVLDFLESFYTEKFLPEVQPETIEIDGKKYNKQDILDRIKELKEV